MRVIEEELVAQLLVTNTSLVHSAIEEALHDHRGENIRILKNSLRLADDGSASDRLTSMMGFIGSPPSTVGFKLIGSNTRNKEISKPRASALVVLCEPSTFAPIVAVESTYLSLMRTAYTALMGINKFYPDAEVVRVFGNGDVAKTLMRVLADLKPGIKVILTSRANALTANVNCDVIVTATTANHPFLTAERTKHVKLLINLGLREVEKEAIGNFDHIVCDDLESCSKQQTPFGEMIRNKTVKLDNIQQFSHLFFEPRNFANESVYFQPSGMVAIDLLLASKVADAL